MLNKQDKWIQSQANQYSKKSFGEADQVVDMNLKAYQEAINIIKPNISFLDLGTNSGRVAWESKQKGAKELGIDLPEVISKIKYDINKQALNLEVDFPNGEWDIIFCRETIEHLRNYKEVCKKIINALTKEGTLIITAPNNKMDGPKNCPHHVRIFEKDSLDKLVIDCGGKIIKYFNERRQRVVVARKNEKS